MSTAALDIGVLYNNAAHMCTRTFIRNRNTHLIVTMIHLTCKLEKIYF